MEEGDKTSCCVERERNVWTCGCIQTIVAAMERNDCDDCYCFEAGDVSMGVLVEYV